VVHNFVFVGWPGSPRFYLGLVTWGLDG